MNDLRGLNWPRKGDKAFSAKGSLRDPSFVNAAVLPFPEFYAYGYKDAADKVVEAAEHDDQYAHALFFPVVFLYRHYLELTLKNLVRLSRKSGTFRFSFTARPHRCPKCRHKWVVNEDILLQHDLGKLWKQVRKFIEDAFPNNDSETAEALEATEKIVQEFHNLDPSGTEIRYPSHKSGRRSLTIRGSHQLRCQRASLKNLKLTMERIDRFLDPHCAADQV